MPRLLFVSLAPSSFVTDDAALLAEDFDVRAFTFDAAAAKGAKGMARRLGAQAKWLVRELPRADAVLGWFADYHLLLPILAARAARVPVAVALGGFEANVLPAVGYGVMRSGWRAPLARRVLRGADLLLPVSAALMAHENRFGAWPDELRNGVLAHVTGLDTPATVIPTGYDADAWTTGPDKRPASVVTVAYVNRPRTAFVKGLDLVLDAARAMPDVRFRVIGVDPAFAPEIPDLLGEVPANVTLDPPVPRPALADAYASASVVASFSRTEGLPNVLCEAMLCGAIPVASRVGGSADAVEGVGVMVETPETDALVAGLREALAMPPSVRHAARTRIATAFTRERRRTALRDALTGLIASGPRRRGTP